MTTRIPRALAATLLLFIPVFLLEGCAITATRPTQEMSDTAAALRAAKEVQADVLAPELYRQGVEWFFKARREFRFKYYKRAKNYARKARRYAEEAELESLINGGNRANLGKDPLADETEFSEDEGSVAEEIPDPESPQQSAESE